MTCSSASLLDHYDRLWIEMVYVRTYECVAAASSPANTPIICNVDDLITEVCVVAAVWALELLFVC